jgi:urease accessory protein
MNETLLMFTEHLPAKGRERSEAVNPVAPQKLVLPFEQREKTRQRACIAGGQEIGIQLPRGTVLRGGDRLRAGDGTVVEVVAAREPVSTVWSRDLRQLARAAYHLGNRHVALEVGTGWVRYRVDHVLDAMVEQLGLAVQHGDEPFEPEAGAYGGHSHTHAGSGAPFLQAPHEHDRGHAAAAGHAHDHGSGGLRLHLQSHGP